MTVEQISREGNLQQFVHDAAREAVETIDAAIAEVAKLKGDKEAASRSNGRTCDMTTTDVIEASARTATSRVELWAQIVNGINAQSVAEIGVYRGEFSAEMLRRCSGIAKYFMVDPWRHLNDWNKPFNTDDDEFERIRLEALDKTQFAADRRHILRGTTTEVAHGLPALDLCHIDGDHTLRGITIDLVRLWMTIRDNGIIGGDDFFVSGWDHGTQFEPTLVFPFAVHFSEAMGCVIYGLPFNQFAIVKSPSGFAFRDLAGKYSDLSLCKSLARPAKLSRLAKAIREAGKNAARGVRANIAALFGG